MVCREYGVQRVQCVSRCNFRPPAELACGQLPALRASLWGFQWAPVEARGFAARPNGQRRGPGNLMRLGLFCGPKVGEK